MVDLKNFYKALQNCDEDFLRFLKENSRNSKILDYGCGVGQYLKK